MRRVLLVLAIALVSIALPAQNILLKTPAGVTVNDDTITYNHIVDTINFQFDFKHDKFVNVINNSSGPMSIDLEREEIQIIPGSGDYFCWGSECKLERIAGTTPRWSANDPVITAAGDTAGGDAPLSIYISHNNNVGVAIFKYTFTDINSGDNASVYVRWVLDYPMLTSDLIRLVDPTGTEVNDDTITYTHAVDTVNFQFDFKHDKFVSVINNSSVGMSIDLEREEIQIIPGSGDYFCWGSECKLERIAGTTPRWSANDPVLTAPGDTAGGDAPLSIYISHNNQIGTAIFKYTFTDINSGENSSVYVKWILTYITSVSENELENKFSIYPNPASDEANINFDEPLRYRNQSLELYNILGEKVKSLSMDQGTQFVELSTSDLKSGIYFINIVAEGVRVGSKKLIVK